MAIIGVPLRYTHLSDGRGVLYLEEKLRRTFQKAGAFVIPICQVQDVCYADTRYKDFLELSVIEKNNIDKYLDLCDGVVFPGGKKITPYDRYLLERCIELKIPVLGICLGMQLMSCYKEDFYVEKNDDDNHNQDDDYLSLTHNVKILKDSLLYKIIGVEEIKVNSFHNYHALENNFYRSVGYSSDGFIEAIELDGDVFNLGIQWHPEISYDYDDNSKKIIDYFIMCCERR